MARHLDLFLYHSNDCLQVTCALLKRLDLVLSNLYSRQAYMNIVGYVNMLIFLGGVNIPMEVDGYVSMSLWN